MNLYEKFYESIGYAPYQEIRIFQKNGYIKSLYATDVEETKKILQDNKEHNCYVGINPRKNKGRKNTDVAYRRSIIFDIEMIGNKLPLTDKQYREKLNRTVDSVQKYMQGKFKFNYNWLLVSGRGVHLYFLIKPLDIEYQKYFNKFYSAIMNDINRNLSDKDMKIDVMLKDLPRIASAPGTYNTKYPEESAYRKIISYKEGENNLLPILKLLKHKIPEPRRKTTAQKGNKCTIKNIWNKPEFKIFTYRGLPKGTINNRLRTALKLLMRENGFTYEETEKVALKISENGYPYKNMYMSADEYPEYSYTRQTINNWCISEFEWCVVNNFKLPYPLSYKPDPNARNIVDKMIIGKKANLTNWSEVIDYAIYFNNLTYKVGSDKTTYYIGALEENLRINCTPVLWQFIEMNHLFHTLKHRLKNSTFNDDVSEFLVGL